MVCTNGLSKCVQLTLRRYSQCAKKTNSLICEYLDGPYAGITVFGLNRPEAKNALSANLAQELNKQLATVSMDAATRVLVVRSMVPGIFCAGADLKERADMAPSQVGQFVTRLRLLMERIAGLPFPVIAAIDGAALGGGLELGLACDLRVAARTAKMGLVETKLAIIPGAGGTQRLPRIVGPAVAKELIFTGRMVDGEEAHRLGLVGHCVAQTGAGDAAFGKALEIAREIAANGPVAVRAAKLAINEGSQLGLSAGLVLEEACYARVIPTKDRVEGLQAFKERRQPLYKGE